MSVFHPPKTEYSDSYDQARYNLVWFITLVFTGLILLLTTVNFTTPEYSPMPYVMALVMSAFSLFLLFRTRKYEVVSKIISAGGLFIVSYTFLCLAHVIQYTPPLWIIINVLFTYFTQGRLWGHIVLGLHFLVVVVYFYLRFQDNLAHLPVYSDYDVHMFVIEYVILGLLIGYFLHVFVSTTYHAERKSKISNARLNIKNGLISKQNEEKELMMKEIHHRVKNNLQVITSLLRLQSYEMDGEENKEKFTEAIGRIKAMALIHEKMYQKEMLENFDLRSYIYSLSNDILTTYSVTLNVEFEVKSEIDHLGSRTIVPVALLFNELISNSIKHAFREIDVPRISISLVPLDDDMFELTYSDNGIWKEASEESFGLELINTMTEQLDGELVINKSDSGTCYRFKLKNLSERFDQIKT
ncbi:MAG: sensor histidine kinase [Flavobacteriales bacterium]|nr:sensor histidine kinase [Flavobacteriales bacterium]